MHTDDYYSGPIELIDGLLDVTKKTILAQIEWTEQFQVST